MIELNGTQLLVLTLASDSAALVLIAGVFLLVLRATHRVRGRGWFCGWMLAALGPGIQAAALAIHRQGPFCDYAATICAIAASVCTARASLDFVKAGRMPRWALAVLVVTGAGALAIASRAHLLGVLLAPELALVAATTINAIAFFPAVRRPRMSGLQTACAASALLTLLMTRTLISSAILAVHHQQLNALYWTIEAIVGGIFAFFLAMGQLVAMLDEVRVELEESNGALSSALQGLEIAAKMDSLTGLYNRYAFHTVIADLRRHRTLDGSIVALDLNGLKYINDTFGHHAGDRALRSVAQRLQEMVRASDFVFRWGGDEFVLLLFEVAPDVARDRLAHMKPPEPLTIHGREPVPLSVSWGVAPLAYDVEGALRDADAQLYEQRRLLRRAVEKIEPV